MLHDRTSCPLRRLPHVHQAYAQRVITHALAWFLGTRCTYAKEHAWVFLLAYLLYLPYVAIPCLHHIHRMNCVCCRHDDGLNGGFLPPPPFAPSPLPSGTPRSHPWPRSR